MQVCRELENQSASSGRDLILVYLLWWSELIKICIILSLQYVLWIFLLTRVFCTELGYKWHAHQNSQNNSFCFNLTLFFPSHSLIHLFRALNSCLQLGILIVFIHFLNPHLSDQAALKRLVAVEGLDIATALWHTMLPGKGLIILKDLFLFWCLTCALLMQPSERLLKLRWAPAKS